MQKQNTEHALMTEADTDSSLQLVGLLDQGHGTPIWRAAMLTNQYVFHALLPAVEMYQAFIDDSQWVTTSSEPSLSCGSNAGMLQRNHTRLHWMHTQHAVHPCMPTYRSCCRFSSLYPSPLPVATPEHSFSTLNQLKTPSVVNGR